MFIDLETAWLWDGGSVKVLRFDPKTGFGFVSDAAPQRAGA